MSLNIGDGSIPTDFLEVLFDEEYSDDDRSETVVEDKEQEQAMEEPEPSIINVMLNVRRAVRRRQGEGSLRTEEEMLGQDAILDSDDTTEADEECTSRGGSPQPGESSWSDASEDSPHPSGSRIRYLSVDRTGTRRGRERPVSGNEKRGVGGRLGARREPMLQRFVTDDELPAKLRESLQQVTTVRNIQNSRARARHARRAANVRIGDSTSDAEIPFYENLKFEWKPMDDWNSAKETFLPETSGPTRRFENAYDSFRSFWDDALLSHIVAATNRYAQGVQSVRFKHDWIETNLDEIMVLFAFWMMLGIIKMPTIKSCFTLHPILRTEIYRTMFTETRYWNLNRAFHLVDGSRDTNNSDNVMFPMGPVLDDLNLKFQQNYSPHQDICIDESLIPWKGPYGFKQCIRSKSARGFNMYQLCESSTGYLWSFFVHIGRPTSTSTIPRSVSTVVRLVQPLLNKGHVLYMDDRFNSPMLARYLKQRRTDCVGILRSYRRNVPAVVQKAPLAEGEFVARQAGDVMVVALEDQNRLTCISTFHDVTQTLKDAKPGRLAQFKLTLIDDYIRGMGGVDRLDQTLEPYLVEREQSINWTKKLFKRLLNITIQNARILLETSSNAKVSSLAFRLALVESILERHHSQIPSRTSRPRPPPRVSYDQFSAKRLTERHFLRRIPITAEMRANIRHPSNLGRRQCVWCSANWRKVCRTNYECPQCEVALCVNVCFEQFHTMP